MGAVGVGGVGFTTTDTVELSVQLPSLHNTVYVPVAAVVALVMFGF